MVAYETHTVEELTTKYELEPMLRDIYVEGRADAALLKRFLRDKSCKHVSVYEIDTVELPMEQLRELDVLSNNREQVVLLANILRQELGGHALQATCIVDRDFDGFFGREHEGSGLLLTDYTCFEMYCFNAIVLQRYLDDYLRGFRHTAGDVLSFLRPVLTELFLMRMANEKLGWKLEYLSFERCCEANKLGINFNPEAYVYRYLNKNAKCAQMQEFKDVIEELRAKLVSDARQQMHGHDFMKLLSWFLKKNVNEAGLCEAKVLSRTVPLCVTADDLSAYPLFQVLLVRVTGE